MTAPARKPGKSKGNTSHTSTRSAAPARQSALGDMFAAAYRLSPDMILVSTEAEGCILDINDSYLQLTGYERAELIGHTTRELKLWINPDQRGELLTLLNQHGVVRDLEIEYRKKSGEHGWVLLFAERLELNGEACLVSIAHDITEHKRAEAERASLANKLQQQVRVLDTILSVTPEHFYLHDRSGCILFASPTSLRALGLTADQVIGRTWHALGFPEFLIQGFEERLTSLFETGSAIKSEVVLNTVDGPRCFEQTLSLMNHQPDQARLAVSTLHDITERKQAEEALRRYAVDLQSRNEELDAFARTVAHDLKSPLGNIVGFSEWLLARPELTEETRLDFISTIARNASKMDSIIDELLLLAKVRKGDVEMTPIDMGRVVAEALYRLTFMIAEAKATIYAPDSWPVAMGHAAWVEEVWVNYLSNAIKYGDQPPHIQLGCDAHGDTLRFWVTDNGHGVPAEEREKLFTPFVQLSAVRATGHGLGLSIVRQIVEKMGGTVDCDSGPDGSTFSFTLPATNAPAN